MMGRSWLLSAAVACMASPVMAESSLSISGVGWTQYINGLTPMYKGATNYDYQPFVNAGGLLFLNDKISENWLANFSMGVAYQNTAIKKTLRDTSGLVLSHADPKTISIDMGAFLYEANLAYQSGPYSLKVGKFHYVYSDYNTNMGLYLLRGPVYPGFLYSGFDEIGGLTKTGVLSSWSPMRSLRWDVLASFETNFKPYMDVNLSSFLTYHIGPVEVGAGFESQRLVEFNSCATSPDGVADVNDCLGGNPGAGYVGFDVYQGAYFIIDTTTPGVKDTTTYSLAGTKVMVRGALDFKKMLSGYQGGSKDYVLYFEAALLGVKNYDHIYDKRSERMPILAGLNLPTYGLLDLLSLEVEYYDAPFQNDPYKLVGAYDLFGFGDGNNLNYATSPIPPSNKAGGAGTNRPRAQEDFNPDKDNWKWSLLATKQLNQKISLKVQLASDHWRVPNNNLVQYEAMANPGEFYGAVKIVYGL